MLLALHTSAPQRLPVHVSSVAHSRPQLPQLLSSVLRSTQLELQQVPVTPPLTQLRPSVPVVQVVATQAEFTHARPVPHWLPQLPQFIGSIERSVQPLPGQHSLEGPASRLQNLPISPRAQVVAALTDAAAAGRAAGADDAAGSAVLRVGRGVGALGGEEAAAQARLLTAGETHAARWPAAAGALAAVC